MTLIVVGTTIAMADTCWDGQGFFDHYYGRFTLGWAGIWFDSPDPDSFYCENWDICEVPKPEAIHCHASAQIVPSNEPGYDFETANGIWGPDERGIYFCGTFQMYFNSVNGTCTGTWTINGYQGSGILWGDKNL